LLHLANSAVFLPGIKAFEKGFWAHRGAPYCRKTQTPAETIQTVGDKMQTVAQVSESIAGEMETIVARSVTILQLTKNLVLLN
jgi:hypothetical protein